MKRAWVWGGGTLTLAFVTALVGLLPGWRWQRELAAARREGLLLEMPRRRGSPQTTHLLAAWMPAQNALDAPVLSSGIVRVIQGRERPGDQRRALAWSKTTERHLAGWKTLSRAPNLGLSPEALDRGPFGGIEIEGIRSAGLALILAAVLEHAPEENLTAAARLSSRLRAEPGLACTGKGVLLGEECLRVAQRKGLSHEVEAALGPSTDFRHALALGLPGTLRAIQIKDPPLTIGEWIEDHNPLGPDPRFLAVSHWRRIWRELPKDPTDFLGAAQVIERRLPEILDLENGYSDPRSGAHSLYSAHVRALDLLRIGDLERVRRMVRR